MTLPELAPVAGPTTAPDTAALLALDADNRARAIDASSSFIIEAPAGAGKTELLTQRFLALLAKVDEPEEVVALTFTNKAAAEMRHRVAGSLALAAAGVEPPEPHRQQTYRLGCQVLACDRQRQWGLLAQPARLQITTLDALCGRLARQMPLLSRLGSQPGIATDAQPYYAQAAQETLQALEDGQPAADSIERVLAYLDNDTGRFQSLLTGMLASRDQWLRHQRQGVDLLAAERALADLIEDELALVTQALPAALQAELMPAVRFAASSVLAAAVAGPASAEFAHLGTLESWRQTLTPDIALLPCFRGLAECLLTKGGDIRSRLPAEFGFSTPEGQGHGQAFRQALDRLRALDCAGALARIRQLPDPGYDAAELRLIDDLVAVLKLATARLWLVFRQARVVDFPEMAQNALLALGDEDAPTDLQLQLDYRISHLLVDEFQDTNPTQVELLRKLTAGWQAGDGRTLFLVGDPMQSIYKFRKADVGLFIKVRDNGLGPIRLTPLRLYRNNRSHASVVQWVNAAFPQVFAGQDDPHRGAVRFVPAQATKGEHALARVALHAIVDASPGESDDDEALGNSADQREARQVIALLRQTQAEDPQASVAVLVRARTHLQALVAALRQEQPPLAFQAVEIEALAQRQMIQDLLSLTRALHHLADRTAWLAILRAPWCGLQLADLHALAAHDHASAIWRLMHDARQLQRMSADGRQRLAHVQGVLAEAFEHQGRQRPRRWVEGVWHSLGGPLCLTEPRDLADAQAFFQVLDNVSESGVLDLSRLDQELDKLFAAPDPAASDRVQIMTVHKSKGLEFDTVILPGLHRSSRPTERPLLIWDEVTDAAGRERLVVAALRAGQPAAPSGPAKFDFLHGFEAARTQNESQRLLYVAATRARRQLHLLGIVKTGDGADDALTLRAPARGSLLALLWHLAELPFLQQARAQLASGAAADPDVAEPMDAAAFTHRLLRLAAPGLPAPLALPGQPAQDGLAQESAQEATQESAPAAGAGLSGSAGPGEADGQLAADVGTLVHRYLEMVAQDGLAQWSAERIDGLQDAMRMWLQTQGHAPQQAAQAAADVQRHLRTTLASGQGRWVLAARADAGSEVPLTRWQDGAARAHVLDRTFVQDGVRWIVDYKTTQHPLALGPAGERAAIEPYRAQLERYRQLYAGAQPVRLGVFFTHHGRLLTLDD